MKCRHCEQIVMINYPHHCQKTGEVYENDGSECADFILSAGVAAITDSAILGALVGGDVTGAIVGDVLFDGSLFD